MILSDNHIHTLFSADSDADITAHLKKAHELGFTSVCFTDHMDYGFVLSENGKEFVFDVDDYFKTLTQLQKNTADVAIRIGVELGLKEDIFDEAMALTKNHPFDFVIGSTHLIDDFDPYYDDYWEHFGEIGGIKHYYETTYANICQGFDFDVYGHIDYVIRYAPTLKKAKKEGTTNDAFINDIMKQNDEILDATLHKLIDHGQGIEVNTGGFLAGLGHPNPHEAILTRYCEMGGEILSVGSDAHNPKNLGDSFECLPALLSKCGFSYYTEFKNRKPIQIKL